MKILAKFLIFLLCDIAQSAELGFLELRDHGEIYLHPVKPIESNDIIVVSNAGAPIPKDCCVRLSSRSFLSATRSDSMLTETGEEATTYKFIGESARLAGRPPQILIAAIGDIRVIGVRPNSLSFVESRRHYRIATCHGSEGLNARLYQGHHQIQTAYFYFGYDIQPTCK